MVHVGVVKTLVKHNIPIDYIAGSSIGAWVGAHYALYQDIDKLAAETIGKRKEKLQAFFEPTFRGGLVKGEKVEKLLTIFFNDKTFADVHVPLGVVATDFIEGKQVIFTEGKLAPAVRASMAVPTIFRPVVYAGKTLVDGGVTNPVPDDIVRGMGADIVISITLNNLPSSADVGKIETTLTNVTSRSFEIMRHALTRYSLSSSDVIIEPYLPYTGLSSWRRYFTQEIGTKIIKIGAEETERAMPRIEALLRA